MRLPTISLGLGLIVALSSAAVAKTEKEFLTDAIKGDNSEVAIGHLALSKSESGSVKAFGQTLVDDHSKHRTMASEVANKVGVTPPDQPSTEAQNEMSKLDKLTGREFDKEFVHYMVKDHEKDIAEYKQEASAGQGPVQKLASESLPTLQKHLDIAKSLSAKL